MQLVVQASDKPYTCAMDRPATYTRHTQHFIFAFFLSVHACEKSAHQQNLSTYRSINTIPQNADPLLKEHWTASDRFVGRVVNVLKTWKKWKFYTLHFGLQNNKQIRHAYNFLSKEICDWNLLISKPYISGHTTPIPSPECCFCYNLQCNVCKIIV